ncbi:MAG TPA: DUF255 domain-containing protein [Candidatus Baltobacteraceae bacterium]|nr:DUF255 domain-containing protein [Candidatus Baltobacteraceae bacterium]
MHFSPRPNRAHEIDWLTWSPQAFERAQRENKPVLLAISAVWCHWCHVMDETSYSDPEVIAAINARYVAVRVDNDRRPDVNARYNQGGWPTTAFLTPDGALLAGATYLPPDQMRQALEQISDFYRTNREEIAERAAEIRSNPRAYTPASADELRESIVHEVAERIAQAYDEEYGGFGEAPKFPMIDALEFLLQEYRVGNEQRHYDMVAKSLLAMSSGGMYDHVEGGFFRYSTTRDWSVPHFEKMTEDHAGLIRLLAILARTTRNDRFRQTLVSATGYVRTVLLDPRTRLFAGSQDADETYYARPLEERRTMQPPYVDRTSYSNWSAAMAGAFVMAGDALEDDRLVEAGEAALDALHERMRDSDGLLYHFIEASPDARPRVRGLLTDQAAYLRALLDAHEYTGEARFLDRARALVKPLRERFGAADGGFYDHAALEEPLGNLPLRERPLPDNALLAECFLRLHAIESEPEYRSIAEDALRVYARTYRGAGLFAAPYARALRRYLSPLAYVNLVGSAAATAELREAAHALPDPLLVVHTTDRADGAPEAYLCRGTACAAPARTIAELREAFEMLAV